MRCRKEARASWRVYRLDKGKLWNQYEGHLMNPQPDTLTPENIASDLFAVADAAGAGRFACYGYSWLALSRMQLAIRTDRRTALIER